MERAAIEYAIRYIGEAPFKVSDNHQAHLLIELDGNNMDVLYSDCEKIAELMAEFNCDEILFADSENLKNNLWKLRRNAGSAVLNLCKEKISEDTVVPRALLPDLLRGVKNIAHTHDVETISLGHLGDGNMHIFIVQAEDLGSDTANENWKKRAYLAKTDIFKLVKSLNGALSAEHGVGFTQKDYMPLFFNDVHIEILRGIKKVFDPKWYFEPSKDF